MQRSRSAVLVLGLVACTGQPFSQASPQPSPQATPPPAVAYVADDDRLRAYTVDSTGNVEQIADLALGAPGSGYAVTHSPDGRVLAVLLRKHRVYKYSDEWIATFRLDETGAPSRVVTQAIGESGELGSQLVMSDGFLHVVSRDGGLRMFNLDPVNPVPVKISARPGVNPSAAATYAARGLLAFGQGERRGGATIGLYRNTETGPQPLALASENGERVAALAFAPDGSLLHVAIVGSAQLADRIGTFAVSEQGDLTLRDELTPRLYPHSLAALGEHVFVSYLYNTDVDAYHVDRAAGRLVPLGTVGSALPGAALASDPQHGLLAVREAERVALWRVGADGSLTLVAAIPHPGPVDLVALR